MMTDRISTIMSKKVVTVGPDDSLDKVKELVFEKHYHHLPVIDGDKLVGIITSWDLFKSNVNFEDYSKHKVKEFMTTKVATLQANEMIGAAAMVFLRHLFHGLPIVDADMKLVGIVTTHDILVYNFKKENPDNKFLEETHWIEGSKGHPTQIDP